MSIQQNKKLRFLIGRGHSEDTQMAEMNRIKDLLLIIYHFLEVLKNCGEINFQHNICQKKLRLGQPANGVYSNSKGNCIKMQSYEFLLIHFNFFA